MKRLVTALGVMALSLAGVARAQDENAVDGLYWRVAAGATFVSNLEQSFAPAAPGFGQTLSVGESFTAAAALGFDYADGIRTELEYRYEFADIDSITIHPPLGPDLFLQPNENLRAHLVMANFYFDFNNNSDWTPFIGGGVGGAFVTNENGDSDAALAYQGRAGLSYDFGGDVEVSAEYIYLRSRDLVFAVSPTTGLAPGGDNYISSSAMLSFRKLF